jgi:hypothetical protein
LCYERGAEDNLTAVVVSIGPPLSANDRVEDLEKTIQPETRPVAAIAPAAEAQTVLGSRLDSLLASSKSPSVDEAASAMPQSNATREARDANVIENRLDLSPPARSGVERTMTRFFIFVLFLGLVGAAFFAGRKYKGPIPYVDSNTSVVAEASPTPVVGDDPILKFERSRREVDNNPNAWLGTQLKGELSRQQIQNPLDSNEGEFLYLYGRARLLSGANDEAGQAFEKVIAKTTLASPQADATLKKEAALGLAAIALNSDKDKPNAQARFDQTLRPTPAPSASSPLKAPSP